MARPGDERLVSAIQRPLFVWAAVIEVDRLLRVEFGPSRSRMFGKAVALAQGGLGECAKSEPGRYRVTFLLAGEAALYTALGRLLERVRHWRASEVYEDDELVSTYQAKEMAWCASFQLNYFGECRERFQWGVMPRCALCPLFVLCGRNRGRGDSPWRSRHARLIGRRSKRS